MSQQKKKKSYKCEKNKTRMLIKHVDRPTCTEQQNKYCSLLRVSAVQAAHTRLDGQASQLCAGSVLFIELLETEVHAQSGVHHSSVGYNE